MKRFHKGQTIYVASERVNEVMVGDKIFSLTMVIERTVDSCGERRMTFEDHGEDFVFGKSSDPSAPHYHATPAEAFDYLRNLPPHQRITYHIHPEVMSDRSRDWLAVADSWEDAIVTQHLGLEAK